jgi:hypothetical protein
MIAHGPGGGKVWTAPFHKKCEKGCGKICGIFNKSTKNQRFPQFAHKNVLNIKH